MIILPNKKELDLYKKYNAKDIKIIKDAIEEKVDQEELLNKKELEELEKMD